MLTPPSAALAALLDGASPLAPHPLPLAEAHGRFLAGPLAALLDAPACDESAMDGFAVRSADVAAATEDAPARLPLHGESRAGGPWPPPLPPGHAMPIFTGAPLPEGADAVVVREDAERFDDAVALRTAAPPGHHVRAQAKDLAAGGPLLARGARLHAGALALLASQGVEQVSVAARPRVAILTTGDELVPLGQPLAPGKRYDSNGPMLEALVREFGGAPRRVRSRGDDLEALTRAVEEALADTDVLLTTGGVSVGDHDHTGPALRAAGVELAVTKVAIKPGKPTWIGRAGAARAIGLPGNPASAFAIFHAFVRPLLRTLHGDPAPHPATTTATLRDPARHRPGRLEFARARLEPDGVHLHPRQGSGHLSSLAWATHLALLPADRGDLAPGDPVRVFDLSAGGGWTRSVFDDSSQPSAPAAGERSE